MTDGKTANEISDSICQHATTGTLTTGETLPPVRELVTELGVSRNTVATAYKRLVTSGLAQSPGRNGTVIKEITAPVALKGGNPNTPLIDLSGGNPAPSHLPDLSSYFAKISKGPRLYGDAAVSPGSKAWASQWMQNIVPGKGKVNITSDITDAIERLLCAHLLLSDGVVVEDLRFLSSISMLRYAGFSTSPTNVDYGGILPGRLELALQKGVWAMVLTPHTHNFTGCSPNASRTMRLQGILARYPQTLVIVDDHFALPSACHQYPVTAKEITYRAITRSMSKTLGLDLRLVIVANDPLISGRLRLWLNSGSQWVSHLLQGLVCAYPSDETYQHTLAQIRQFYAAQQRTLAVTLRRHSIELPVGGSPNMWLPLENSSQTIAFTLAKSGWLMREGEMFGVNTPAYGLRITLSILTDSDIDRLATDIHRVLER